MIDEARTVATPDGDMGVVVVRPDGDGPFPVVVLFHHGPGLDDGIRQALLVFARAGYLVAAPDRYHRHGSFLTVDVARLIAGDLDAEASRRFREMAGGVTDAMVESDLVALLDHLAADPAARGAPMAC
ncbi:MAG TPA: dienelactone hydrolase family protein, partial [Acidimicrobiales bacterium]|nr:dienelactone hydrolase family protein [Acidimicrobiales bacterium]